MLRSSHSFESESLQKEISGFNYSSTFKRFAAAGSNNGAQNQFQLLCN